MPKRKRIGLCTCDPEMGPRLAEDCPSGICIVGMLTCGFPPFK